MVDDKEITAGWDLIYSMVPQIEAVNKGWLSLDGSSGGVSSGEGLRFYSRSRRKRRKMSNSDETGCSDKKKETDGSAFEKYVHRLSFDAFSNGSGECSLRKCSNVVIPQSNNGHIECIQIGPVTNQESGHTPLITESRDDVERIDIRTDNSALEPSHVLDSEFVKRSEGSTSSDMCGHALFDTLSSEKFSELSGLLLKNFGVVNATRVLGLDAISLKLKNGDYDTSPMLYHNDIQEVFTKLREGCNEIITLANSLDDIAGAKYEQYVRKPMTAEAFGCRGCLEKADVKNCLVCDSCEDIYHLSCTELVGTPIPPKSWYCANCVSNGKGSPHDGCIVCEKLKSAASIPLLNSVPKITNNQSQDVPDGLDEHPHTDVTDDSQISKICFVCKTEVKIDDNFRTCGHSLCEHKFYHYKCLTSRQLGVRGPYWYCPSCLCRHCLVDKDDDQIVLCDGCDQAYHIYCTSPQLFSIPKGEWFCEKCERGLKTIRKMKALYENMQKNVKVKDESEKVEHEAPMDEREGIDMLVTAAKTLSHPAG